MGGVIKTSHFNSIQSFSSLIDFILPPPPPTHTHTHTHTHDTHTHSHKSVLGRAALDEVRIMKSIQHVRSMTTAEIFLYLYALCVCACVCMYVCMYVCMCLHVRVSVCAALHH